MGTEVKHPLSPPPGEIWAGVVPSRSIAPAVSVALEAWQGGRVGHGHTKEYPPGNPTLGGHSLAQGQELKTLCVHVVPGISLGAVVLLCWELTQSSVCSLCSVGRKILFNYYESDTINDFRNKIHAPDTTLYLVLDHADAIAE